MSKIRRNARCPCGSGKKYKHCCLDKENAMRDRRLPAGRFEYKPGSYGGSGEYFPSLMCYKETEPGQWQEYYCLLKYDAQYTDEDEAAHAAEQDLNAAYEVHNETGNPVDVAISLRHRGYRKLEDFHVVDTYNEGV